jgi:hypothetical protein
MTGCIPRASLVAWINGAIIAHSDTGSRFPNKFPYTIIFLQDSAGAIWWYNLAAAEISKRPEP